METKAIGILADRSVANARQDIVKLCHSGLDSLNLRIEAIRGLRRVLPIDSFWFATADPATLLFTSSAIEAIPESATPLFIANEFLQDDVNKFIGLAKLRPSVGSLFAATEGQLERSRRYRDILAPLGFGDELRAALHDGGSCWGFMCLHRDRTGLNFTPDEAEFLAGLVPHLAQGLRAALLHDQARNASEDEGPGLLLLADDLSLISVTPAGKRWLAEIADWPNRSELPQVVYAAVAQLTALECNPVAAADLLPRTRVRTRSGCWLTVHASRLTGRSAAAETAVILEPAHPTEIAPLLLNAYGLTPREAEVAQLVLHGVATSGIAATLSISNFTVQQHLKSVFDKVGVGSRREVVAQMFAQQYRTRNPRRRSTD